MMLKNYLIVSLRNFLRYRLYTVINVAGLATGLACCVLIGLFVSHELSFDRQFANADRIVRVSRDFFPGGSSTLDLKLASMAPQAAGLLREDFPEVQQTARLYRGNFLISRDDQSSTELDYWVDPEFLEMFAFDWLAGDPATALRGPGAVVLTETVARKFFGDANALGESLAVAGHGLVEVTGVIRDLPDNTHFNFSLLGSLATLVANSAPNFLDDWSSNGFFTYALLDRPEAAAELQAGSGAFFEKHLLAGASAYTGFAVMPLRDIHLRSGLATDMKPSGSLTTVYVFSGVAVFILLIACFNFMNLATARASQRAREVGVRKTVGAERSQLVMQFLGESVLIALLALCFALVFVELALPAFSALMGVALDLGFLSDPLLMGTLCALTLLVGIGAGSYPAFYLSAFNSTRVLKGELTRGSAAMTFRKILVVSQFAITITLLVATATFYLQMRYSRNYDFGYDSENVVVLFRNLSAGTPGEDPLTKWQALKSELLAHPGVTSVTASSMRPAGRPANSATSVRHEGGDPAGMRGMPMVAVDYGFFETYGIDVLAGRTFSEAFSTDRLVEPGADNPHTSGAYILNELTARQFGWSPEEAVGKWVELSWNNRFAQSVKGLVVGVVENTNFKSARDALEPMVYFVPPGVFAIVSVKISNQNTQATLAHLDDVWTRLVSDLPVQRSFVEQDVAALYRQESQQAQMLSSFSVLAMMVACMGLLGLASFATERRLKEIGVRKVMGGSVLSIVLLLTNDFSKLVLIANVIAWPVAYFAMSRWLESFAYRIDLTPLVFIGSGLIALCIAWVTVGGTAAKAATQKPVLALRYE